MRKIPGGSESANILVGQVDFLDEPVVAFARLAKPAVLADLTEVGFNCDEKTPTYYYLIISVSLLRRY